MIKQPIGLKVYTNVSIVRLKIGKGRYEIACYPNKVQDYREKKEKDIKEVLQTREIFKNAIKGDIVPKKELKEVFPNMEHDQILKLILEKGEIQTGEKERITGTSNLKNDIANIIVEKTYNKETGLPFPHDIIIKVLEEIQFIIHDKDNAKKQALKAIKDIQNKKILPLERKLMQLYITIKSKEKIGNFDDFNKNFLDFLNNIQCQIIEQDINNIDSFYIKCNMKPNFYRDLLNKYDTYLNFEVVSQGEIPALNYQKENNKIEKENNKNEKKENNETEMRISHSNVEKYLEENYEESKKNKKKLHCTKCKNSSFDTQDELRQHCKSNWHKFNALQSAKGKESYSAEEYDEYVLMNPEELK